MLIASPPTAIDTAVARLDAWLDTMRAPGGYGGPVAHWWQQSLIYTGPGLDWRYEGIIAGYLHLWQASGDLRWLLKARRAGDDLVQAQQPDGHYPASAFEINPATAGTPHEAACDVGLLLLAIELRAANQGGWEPYAACAERNLRQFYVQQLWDAAARSFRDSPRGSSFVPNKAATICDALFALADLSGDACWVEHYALPTLDRVLAHQVRGGALDGAIAQNSLGGRTIARYFPIYIARCVGALAQGYRWSGDERYLDAALRAMQFVARHARADGTLPTVVYPRGRANRYPCWIAALGDVLRAADELRPYGFDADFSATERWLLAHQDASGAIQTARGFCAQAGGALSATPDVRDVLHVVGWCDKAFRYLAARATDAISPEEACTFSAPCTFVGQSLCLTETATVVEITGERGVCYRWHKGDMRPVIAAPEFWLR